MNLITRRCKMEVHHEDQSTCSRLEDLPIEVIRRILEKVPIDSLPRCKLLNKYFCRIVSDQEFAINHFSAAAKKNPFVLILHRKSFYLLNMDSTAISEHSDLDVFKKINAPFQLPDDADIIGSCYGYLCLSSSSPVRHFRPCEEDVTLIWNPFTSHFLELPATSNRLSEVCGFGFHPLTRELKVMKIFRNVDRHGMPTPEPYMQIFTLGTDEWRTLKGPSALSSRSIMGSGESGVCVNGSMYWLVKSASKHVLVVALDLATEEFTEFRPPYDDMGRYWERLPKFGYPMMTEIRGCLAMLVHRGDQLEVWVLRNSWTLLFCIGNYVNKMNAKQMGDDVFLAVSEFHKAQHAICLLEDDKLLMFSVGMLCYDFKNESFVDFKVRGLFGGHSHDYHAIAHAGSLIRIK